MFFQQVVNGLTIGSMYALVAIGYTMVFGVLKLVNFSHGSVFMVGAYLTLQLSIALGGHFFLAAALSLLLTGVLGVAIDRCALRRLREKKADRITALISTLGVATILDNGVMIAFGSETKAFPNVLQLGKFTIGGTVVSWVQIIILLLALVLMGAMSIVVYRTKMGRAMRATSQNADAAKLMGINVNYVVAFTFFVGSLLASVAGTMYGMYYEAIDPLMGSVISMKTFACVVLGGVGVLPGAMLGGLLIGVVEAVGASYISSGYRDAIAFAILILVLVLRPQGILGKKVADKI
ncbi:branched-chain amino acid ABC transporter permease [Agathobaculum sp.]|uniref:branched-chain amino acid ABC transporter permease n=1 Tax=Agathobaculum sp. TaxID=2048138 RepID=UPI002A80494E|nr:branched-chain amino acid ABC transporter permease [Agathobaculum sp.]MDY3617882.1 branched-chain amino acid ABC transporter permease [Agathobaculum sp.]